MIAQALAATNGNVTAAAKKLGISRRTLHRKINEMNLTRTRTELAGVDHTAHLLVAAAVETPIIISLTFPLMAWAPVLDEALVLVYICPCMASRLEWLWPSQLQSGSLSQLE